MNGAIEERVAAAKLTENDKRVLDFIMANRRTACFLTSNEIAAQLGASPSSVVRLSKKLEYENFSAFKRALQEEVAGAPRFEALPVPHERIKEYENLPDEEILAAYMDNVLKNLRGDTNAENDRKIIDAADIILRARRVFIVGFRTCAGFASTAGVMLTCVRPDVFVVGGGAPLIDSLIDITKEDAMIAISFARYSSETAFAARMARDAGCPVIAMTDSYAAPVAKGAAKVIISNSRNMGFFDSYVSFFSNMEKILVLVSKRNRKGNEERLMKMESYLRMTGQY
ncbi:MurR/RpiR family transcriptional regulator [Cloacibacillus evryensis]|uniref:MurR/RpiR family transcriptional regulator n=1 Tax=Cloacibacillus evryensis TaxID=508460 RepID=UPI00241F1A90|nr:MurR/RpiR family transcriptional regulator [Cloacibacillus evryensis]